MKAIKMKSLLKEANSQSNNPAMVSINKHIIKVLDGMYKELRDLNSVVADARNKTTDSSDKEDLLKTMDYIKAASQSVSNLYGTSLDYIKNHGKK